MTTLKASVAGSAVGIIAWLTGVGNWIWPAHPQVALFLLTIVVTMVIMYVWSPEDAAKAKKANTN